MAKPNKRQRPQPRARPRPKPKLYHFSLAQVCFAGTFTIAHLVHESLEEGPIILSKAFNVRLQKHPSRSNPHRYYVYYRDDLQWSRNIPPNIVHTVGQGIVTRKNLLYDRLLWHPVS